MISSLSSHPPEQPTREFEFVERPRGSGLLMKRNCSISPLGLARVFGALAVAVLAVATGFAYFGAWMILPFAGLEVLFLLVVYLMVARHATDHERVEIVDGHVVVDVVDGHVVRRWDIEQRGARVRFDEAASRVLLAGGGAELELGRLLDAASRRRLADELARRLGVVPQAV